MSQGKKIQVSCDTSVMKVSTSGLALRLGVDGGEMRVRHHRAHQPAGLAGVDEVVDDQKPLAGAAAELRDVSAEMLFSTFRSPCLSWS